MVSNVPDCARGKTITHCSHSKDAGVRCSDENLSNCSNGDLRLVGGRDEHEGRVEVCFGRTWGTVCHDDWGYLDASVVCFQLGYSGGRAYTSSYYGYGTGLIFLDNVRCSGFESRLLDCQHNGIGVLDYCGHDEDAGVRCYGQLAQNCTNGDVRLVGGHSVHEGRVEVCYKNRWGTVCGDNWDYRDAVVVCNQLGYSGGSSNINRFGRGKGLILLDEVRCTGYESNLLACRHNGIGVLNYCDHTQDAGVWCSAVEAANCSDGDVRLMDGDVRHEGRVEICYKNRWGTVCHDDWSGNDAAVVCRQLGFSGRRTITGAYFGVGSGLILLDNVKCAGTESSLLDCPHNGVGVLTYCFNDHRKDAGVRCTIL